MTSMVKLGDGSVVAQAVFFTTRMSIEGLVKSDPVALLELVNKCNHVGYQFIEPKSATTLKSCGFMISDERVHDDVKKIVMNCLKVSTSEGNISVTFTYSQMPSKPVIKIELKKQERS